MELPALIHPERLLWLLLLPVLWWLALPPRPRRQLVSAHLRQWLAAQAKLRRRPIRFRALRFLLLATAVVAAVVAHAEPQRHARDGARSLVVLLDHTASMGAASAGGVAPAVLAERALRARLAALPAGVDVRLLAIGGALRELRGGLAEWSQLGPPAGARTVSLAALAKDLAASPGTAVWTLTDGQEAACLPADGALSVFGGPLPNWSLAAAQLDDRWPLPELHCTVTARSFADAPAAGTIAVEGAATAAPQRLELPAGGSATVTFDLQRAVAGGAMTVRLSMPGDALAADDVVVFQLPPLPAPRISLLTENSDGAAIAAAAQALATEVGGSVVDASSGERVAFQLVEGGIVDAAPGSARAIYFGCRGPQQPLQAAADLTVIDWDRSAPLLQGLDFADLRVQAALTDSLPAGRPLLWAQGEAGPIPLLVQVDGEAATSLHCAFRLADSNLWLLPALPQLLRRAMLLAYRHAAAATGGSTLPAVESDLRTRPPATDRLLPAFAVAGDSLTVPCLLLALACLLVRAYLR